MIMFRIMNEIKKSTLALRARTGDDTLGTQVESGKIQLVSVTYDGTGVSTVAPKSEWVLVSDAVSMIENYKAA